MKLAVFSDVHSNRVALEACFCEAERRRADMWIFLGDYVSDCAFPHRTMELLYRAQKEHDCRFVKGNREEYLLNYRQNGGDWKYGNTTGSLLYTYENMTERDMAFIDSLPMTDVIRVAGKEPILICHGAPYKTRVLLEPGRESVPRVLSGIEESVMMSGHSHKPFSEVHGGKLYINPGAVGVPTSGLTGAEMAFVESDGRDWHPEMVRVEYDIDEEIRDICDAGLPESTLVWAKCIIKALKTGVNYPLNCLSLAERLADGNTVDNDYILQAARQLGVI